MKKINIKRCFTLAFLLAEGILYSLILTTHGELLMGSSFASIVLCFAYALLCRGTPLLVAGLASTVAADFFLTACYPRQQLAGMVFFLAVQTLYAIFLHRQGFRRGWLAVRLGLTALITAVAFAVLREKTDALAVISVWYYANLVMNMLMAFGKIRSFPLLAVGLVLFILCDTVVGLQVASEGYLSIGKETLLYRILFVNFNLSWLFYLPSQVLIALTAGRKKPAADANKESSDL